MHLSFSDKKIRQLCEDECFAKKTLGADIAKKLKTRLADIMAANCVTEIPTGSPKEFEINGQFNIHVTIWSPHYLSFCSAHEHAPLNTVGKIDWKYVTRIKILNLE